MRVSLPSASTYVRETSCFGDRLAHIPSWDVTRGGPLEIRGIELRWLAAELERSSPEVVEYIRSFIMMNVVDVF